VGDPGRTIAPDERAALLEGALEATQNGILVFDLERRIVHYNRRILQLFGLTADDVERRGIDAVAGALADQLEDPGQLISNRHELWENPSLEILDTIRFKDGRSYERFIAPNHAGSRIIGRIASFRDVTATMRTAQQQKLEAIGQLAGGIAHDLNNALTAIIGYAELALNTLEDGHSARPDVQEIRRAASRAESVTRQLLAFSRKQLLEPRLFSLAESVTNLGRMLDRLLGSQITLKTIVPPDLPSIFGDPGQIEQAILNIAVNARDAMPDGGRLTMALAVVEIDEAYARVHRPMQPGRHVELSISDTGHGMSPETQAHIFEPFFTTKGVGKGTGLGLAMVYGTVKQSGGYIFVDSELGRGSTFRLYFPPARHQQAPAAEPSPHVEAAASKLILVVEDEGPVRNLVVTALRRKGYQVLHASSGADALAIAGAESRTIDLLLTDASMPGMSGIDLARSLRQQRPDILVVIMSGYTSDTLNLGSLGEAIMLLPKPFTPRELQQKIGEALGGRRAAQPRLS